LRGREVESRQSREQFTCEREVAPGPSADRPDGLDAEQRAIRRGLLDPMQLRRDVRGVSRRKALVC
jgi:hypothetical protein